MKARFGIWLMALAVRAAAGARAQSNSVPARLAIVVQDASASVAADLLTVELSKKDSLQLLEREEIDRVYREQRLSAVNGNFVKLGQVLGADGLLVINQGKEGTNQFLLTRLVAVKPGVILSAVRTASPLADPPQWANWIVGRMGPLFPKLTVLPQDAIPISVVNLRAAVRSVEEQELERQLTLLTIERLTREKQFFVLERKDMGLLTGEKELAGMGESAFWNGSYLLEGVIDRDGYSKETVTVNARLIPPQGGAPVPIEISASRTNLSGTINQLATQVAQALKVGRLNPSWDAAQEAERYFEEASWALRWGMFKEAQSVSEASWALGKKTRETAALLIRSYQGEAVPPQNGWAALHPTTPEYVPDVLKLVPATRALELYSIGFHAFPLNDARADTNWYILSLDLLNTTGELLRQFYYHPEARAGHEEELADLRRLARETVGLIGQHPPHRVHPATGHQMFILCGKSEMFLETDPSLEKLELGMGAYWSETPAEALAIYRKHASTDLLHTLRKYFAHHALTAWQEQDRAKIQPLWRGFIQELCESTSALLKVEGQYLAFAEAAPPEYKERGMRFFQVVSENSYAVVEAKLEDNFFKDIDDLLGSSPWGFIDTPASREVRRYFDEEFESDFTTNALVRYLQNDEGFSAEELGRYGTRMHNGRFRDSTNRLGGVLSAVEDYHARIVQYEKEYSRHYDYRNYSFFDRWLRAALPSQTNSASAPTNRIAVAKPAVIQPSARQITNAMPELTSTNLLRVTKFWKLPDQSQDIPWSGPGCAMGAIRFREGRLWMQVLNQQNGSDLLKAAIIGVELPRFRSEVIDDDNSYPSDRWDEMRSTGDSFEVIGPYLYIKRGGELRRYSFQTKSWDDLHLPMQGRFQLTALGQRLFISTPDSIMEVTQDGQQARVLASLRRRPAVSILDSLESYLYYGPTIFGGTNGVLRALISGKVYTWANGNNDWTETLTMPATRDRSHWASFDQGSVLWEETTEGAMRWFLLENDKDSVGLLLEHWPPPRFGPRSAKPPARAKSPNVRWTYPEDMELFENSIALEGDDLWILAGDLGMETISTGEVRLHQEDGRHALLLDFKKGTVQARAIPIWLDLPKGLITSEMLLSWSGAVAHYAKPQGEFLTYGAMGLRLTPAGLIITAPHIPGFWFIPRADLESPPGDAGPRLKAQQETRASKP